MSPRLPAVFVVALLGLALILPAAASAAERVVSVSADATVKVANDSASFGFSVVRERRQRGAALRAASSKLRAVIAAVKEIPGVGPGDVTTGRISVRKSHHGRRVFYRASEGIGVILHQVENAGELIGVALGKGASGVSGPNYFVSNPAGAFGQALAQAFETAKAKATALATQSGGTLGAAISIDEGEGAEFVASPVSKQDSASGCVTGSPSRKSRHAKSSHTKRGHSKRPRCGNSPAPPTKPGTSTVSAHVHVVFELR